MMTIQLDRVQGRAEQEACPSSPQACADEHSLVGPEWTLPARVVAAIVAATLAVVAALSAAA